MPSDQVLPTILIAEDDATDVLLLKETLISLGTTQPMRSFGNGAEVIQFLRDEIVAVADPVARAVPRVLFLDLHLPQVDGCGVLAWAKRQKTLASLRIVILSGSGDSSDMRRAASLGADRLMVKPAPTAVLQAELALLSVTPAAGNMATG